MTDPIKNAGKVYKGVSWLRRMYAIRNITISDEIIETMDSSGNVGYLIEVNNIPKKIFLYLGWELFSIEYSVPGGKTKGDKIVIPHFGDSIELNHVKKYASIGAHTIEELRKSPDNMLELTPMIEGSPRPIKRYVRGNISTKTQIIPQSR